MNGLLTCHEHHEAVHTDTHTRGGRHTVLEGTHEVVVDEHGLIVALLAQAKLLLEALQLVDGVVELAIGVAQLLTVDHELETLGELGVLAVTLAEGRHLDGIVGDEGRLYVVALALLAKDLVDELTLAHGLVGLYTQFLAYGTQLSLIHAGDVHSGELLDGLCHSTACEGSLEADDIVAHLHLGSAVHIETDLLEHLLGECHHPVIVLVRDVDLHTGKLGIVGAVHTLVAEVLGELIHTLKATHDKALQVELIGNTQVQGDVQCVMVGDEGACCRSTGD